MGEGGARGSGSLWSSSLVGDPPLPSNVVLIKTWFVPFLNKKFKDLQGHISHFSRTPFSEKKSLESVFFGSSTTWAILSSQVFLCLLLLDTWESVLDKVSTKIQGLPSTDCNFRGLSRCVRTLLKVYWSVFSLSAQKSARGFSKTRIFFLVIEIGGISRMLVGILYGKGDQCGCGSSLKWPPKGDFCVVSFRAFCKFLYAQY